MLDLLNRYRNVWVSVILLTMPLLFLYVSGRRAHQNSLLERTLLRITAPVQDVSNGIVTRIKSVWDHYIDLVNVKRRNRQLEDRLDRLTLSYNRLIEVDAQNGRLKLQLGYREKFERDHPQRALVYSRVIGWDLTPYYRAVKIRIDRGANDRIESGYPVITYSGVVGRIIKVSGDYAEVMLLADGRSRVAVRVHPTGPIGTLQGETDKKTYLTRFRFLHPTDKVKAGDQLLTSGLGKRYPAGLVVGFVGAGERKQRGNYYEFRVIPAVNFSTLREVFVMVPRGALVKRK